MFVEVLGLPGSGKSSLIRNLMPGLRRDGVRVRTVKNLATLPALDAALPRYISSQPDRLMLYRAVQFRSANSALMRHVDNRPDVRDADRLLYDLTGCYHQAYLEYRDHIDLALVDESFLHRGMDLHMAETDPLVFKTYLDLMPLPGAVIYVNTSARVAFRRAVGRRSEKRANKQRVIEKLGNLDTFFLRRALLEIGLAHLQARGAKLINIDASRSKEDCTLEAAAKLATLLGLDSAAAEAG